MVEKKELSDEELESVNGGCGGDNEDWGTKMSKYLPSDHGKHIGKYEAEGYINQDVYVVRDDDRECYYWGTLLRSWEESDIGCTRRMHEIYIKGSNNYFFCTFPKNTNQEFGGDDNTLFLYK